MPRQTVRCSTTTTTPWSVSTCHAYCDLQMTCSHRHLFKAASTGCDHAQLRSRATHTKPHSMSTASLPPCTMCGTALYNQAINPPQRAITISHTLRSCRTHAVQPTLLYNQAVKPPQRAQARSKRAGCLASGVTDHACSLQCCTTALQCITPASRNMHSQ